MKSGQLIMLWFGCNLSFYQIFDAVVERDSTVQLIRVFGELFGGAYPHKEVQKVQGVRTCFNMIL